MSFIRRRTTARKATLVALVSVVGLLGASLAIGSALAAPKPLAPPAPTITSGPTGAGTGTAAAFTYTDTQAGVAFQCKLDGAGYASCPTSGKSYTGLADGSHTFSVVATSGASPLSPAAARTWSVDTGAPTLVRSFPANNGLYNPAAWAAGCSPAGICGNASDPTGVTTVQVAVYQSGTPTFLNATLGTPGATSTTWGLAMALPSDGSYTVRLRATDAFGNTTATAAEPSAGFRTDATPPPAPVITSRPDDLTTSTRATFLFDISDRLVPLQCRLDGAAFTRCVASAVYLNLPAGTHCFDLRATDDAGNTTTTRVCWTIVLNGFPITGSADQPFYPGVTRSVNLVIGNPYNFTIKVTAVAVSVDNATSKPACAGQTNLVVTQTLTVPVNVPANSSRSLQQLGVASADWPRLTMPNLATNQDACKGASFSIHYTGQASTP